MTPVGSSQKQKRRPHGLQGLSQHIRGDAIVLKTQSAIAPGLHAATIDRVVIHARVVPCLVHGTVEEQKVCLRMLNKRIQLSNR
ncbi:hypothetical protein IWX87_002245 [Polaromonas sp. CG_9.7]|nr:hypothetical protein [Polaromonas sp. CG_9.7]MBG6114486.1 hypothetical protein [Polaromonas sp. CG_9.2]MDH6185437.1 hypothetical protein [Polaromonas sp. CG_23.6]